MTPFSALYVVTLVRYCIWLPAQSVFYNSLKAQMDLSVSLTEVACLQAVCGCFFREKAPQKVEFAIAGANLDARENRTVASDKATGRGRGSSPQTDFRARPRWRR